MTEADSGTSGSAAHDDWASRSHVRTMVLLGATAGGIYLCFRLAVPFLPVLAWALALAVLFAPVQRRLEACVKRPGVAAGICVLLGALILVVPAAFVGQRLALEAVKGAQLIETRVASGEWRRSLEAQPRLGRLVERVERQVAFPDTVKSISQWLSAAAAAVVRGSLYQAAGLCLTFYLLFFFLRDREAALQALRGLSPLPRAQTARLFRHVRETIVYTVYGTLVVSALQGLLGGLMFWWLGLPAPLLWGVVMGLLAVVPVLGAFVVWAPAVLFLALEGSWGAALILTVWGVLVVGTIDNLLRPVLVGKALRLHTLLAFLSVVGGLLVFGPAGLILGPVALTTTMVLLESWPSRDADEPALTRPA